MPCTGIEQPLGIGFSDLSASHRDLSRLLLGTARRPHSAASAERPPEFRVVNFSRFAVSVLQGVLDSALFLHRQLRGLLLGASYRYHLPQKTTDIPHRR